MNILVYTSLMISSISLSLVYDTQAVTSEYGEIKSDYDKMFAEKESVIPPNEFRNMLIYLESKYRSLPNDSKESLSWYNENVRFLLAAYPSSCSTDALISIYNLIESHSNRVSVAPYLEYCASKLISYCSDSLISMKDIRQYSQDWWEFKAEIESQLSHSTNIVTAVRQSFLDILLSDSEFKKQKTERWSEYQGRFLENAKTKYARVCSIITWEERKVAQVVARLKGDHLYRLIDTVNDDNLIRNIEYCTILADYSNTEIFEDHTAKTYANKIAILTSAVTNPVLTDIEKLTEIIDILRNLYKYGLHRQSLHSTMTRIHNIWIPINEATCNYEELDRIHSAIQRPYNDNMKRYVKKEYPKYLKACADRIDRDVNRELNRGLEKVSPGLFNHIAKQAPNTRDDLYTESVIQNVIAHLRGSPYAMTREESEQYDELPDLSDRTAFLTIICHRIEGTSIIEVEKKFKLYKELKDLTEKHHETTKNVMKTWKICKSLMRFYGRAPGTSSNFDP